jgi:hypothetical protein
MPEPAHWAEYVVRKKGLWRTVLRFEIRYIKNIESPSLITFGHDFVPHLVQISCKPGMKPHVVLKNNDVHMITRRNLPPNTDV